MDTNQRMGRAVCRGRSPAGWVAVAAAITGGATTPGVGRAQSAPLPATIEACYVPATGTIYRVNAAGTPKACLSAAHVPFTWNTQGPRGEPGPAGPKGDSGDRGPPGFARFSPVVEYFDFPSTGGLNMATAREVACPAGMRAFNGWARVVSGTPNSVYTELRFGAKPGELDHLYMGVSWRGNGFRLQATIVCAGVGS